MIRETVLPPSFQLGGPREARRWVGSVNRDARHERWAFEGVKRSEAFRRLGMGKTRLG